MTGGSVWGEATHPRLIPEKTKMVEEIIRSSWPAATTADPDDPEARAFVADAIISNPPVNGHVHVAEALGIPCHIMFPQPWYYGTKAFPHPMAGLSYVEGRDRNEQSYTAFESLMWTSFHSKVNSWRIKTLRVPRLVGKVIASNFITQSRIPFSAMWSPAFVPKPDDWPEQCRVVGTFNINKKGNTKTFDASPFADLEAWIKSGPAPVFVGFGSMVIKDLVGSEDIIRGAAKIANLRIVVQSSWSKLDVERDDDGCGGLLRNVGPCPHDWLLPMCCAVVHHGGAGTTAAGLRYGLPTLICPFFADQFMWGEMTRRAGVGPEPLPVNRPDNTAEVLADRFKTLASPEMKEAAVALSEQMALEDGIKGGLKHFFDELPRENMLCDVLLLLGEIKPARYKLYGTSLKVSVEVAAYITILRTAKYDSFESWWQSMKDKLESFIYGDFSANRHGVTNYNLQGYVSNFFEGSFAAFYNLLYQSLSAPFQLYFKPDRFARSGGAFGCLFGIVVGALAVVWCTLYGTILFLDYGCLAITNGCFGKKYEL